MRIYKHRQVGGLMLLGFGLGVALIAMFMILLPSPTIVPGLVLGVLLLCMVLFHALTVEVTEGEVVLSFGPGVIHKRFRVADIRDARIVRNRWYYGWGIRLTGHGWLFNVSGLDAVELELKNNRKIRIGTDDARQLRAAIRRAAGLD